MVLDTNTDEGEEIVVPLYSGVIDIVVLLAIERTRYDCPRITMKSPGVSWLENAVLVPETVALPWVTVTLPLN
jgi:hypothetical protein